MRISLIFSFLLLLGNSIAQDRAYYDSVTYYQFIAKEYKAVLKTGSEALNKEIDFYYLRYRMAFASYETKNFVNSIPHFREMLNMNPSDTIAQEFLYYAYLETVQEENAKIVSEDFTQTMKIRLNVNKTSLNQISVNVGSLFNKNVENNQNTDYLIYQKSASETKLNSGLSIFDLSTKWNLTNRLQAIASISYLQSKTLLIGQIDTGFYRFNEINKNLQANLILSYAFKHQWKTSFGLAYFYNDVPILKNIPPKLNSGGFIVSGPYFVDTAIQYSAVLASLKIERVGKCFQPYLGFSISNQFKTEQFQFSAGMSYLPFGNYNLYGATSFYYLNDNKVDKSIISQMIGFKVAKFVWLETSIMKGNMQNMNLDNGLVTFNTSDPIIINFGFDLILKFKKVSLIPSYRYQIREFTTKVINETTPRNVITPYFNNLVNFAIKWSL